MRKQAIQPQHAINALQNASAKRAGEGAVGAGKGMVCFGYKCRIGTASEVIQYKDETFTFGCLVLSNFGKSEDARFANWTDSSLENPDGSIMIIIATDAPLSSRQLKQIGRASRSDRK